MCEYAPAPALSPPTRHDLPGHCTRLETYPTVTGHPLKHTQFARGKQSSAFLISVLLQAAEERVTIEEIMQQERGTLPHGHTGVKHTPDTQRAPDDHPDTGDEQWKANRFEFSP